MQIFNISVPEKPLTNIEVVRYARLLKIPDFRGVFMRDTFLCIFLSGTMTTHAESINSDLQRGLDRRLRHTQH